MSDSSRTREQIENPAVVTSPGSTQNSERVEPTWSADLPEPTKCRLDDDEGCTTMAAQTHCSCKSSCGEDEAAGCCYCAHIDIYFPCPRFGFACEPDCGDVADPCCTDEQRAFRHAADPDRWRSS